MVLPHGPLLAVLLSASGPLIAQQDSLLRIWRDETRPDTVRMHAAGEALRTLIYQDPDSALRLSMDLHETATRAGDRGRQAFALNFKGMAYVLMGNFYPAVVAYREMLALYEQLDDRRGVAGAHSNLGAVFHQQGDLVRALGHYEQCVPVFEALGDARGKAITASNLSGIHREMGDTASARRLLEQVLRSAEAAEDRSGMAGAYGNLGLLAQDRGDLRGALALYSLSLRYRVLMNDRAGRALMQHDIGEVHRLLGRMDSASHWISASISVRDTLGDEPGLAQALVSLGLLALEQGRPKEAIDHCTRAAMSAADLQLRTVEEKACACLVKACERTGDHACVDRNGARRAVLNDSLQRQEARAILARVEFRKSMVADSVQRALAASGDPGTGTGSRDPWPWLAAGLGALGLGIWWWRRRSAQA
jgi:tetratricopeptide (TPR) repeat protein